MRKFHRINGKAIWINPDHVRFVEQTPDTTLIFADGQRLLVTETLSQTLENLEKIFTKQNEKDKVSESRPWS